MLYLILNFQKLGKDGLKWVKLGLTGFFRVLAYRWISKAVSVTFPSDLESMKFHFDIDKSIAATAYLIQKNGGKYDVIFLVKALYEANRRSLIRYGRSLTGDRLISMKSGTNVSETYDLIDSSKHAKPENLDKWKKFFVRTRHTMSIIEEPKTDCLSQRDVQLLDESYRLIASVKEPLNKWSHNHYPEWKNPTGLSKSLTNDPRLILAIEKKTPEEIEEIEEEIDQVNWLKSVA